MADTLKIGQTDTLTAQYVDTFDDGHTETRAANDATWGDDNAAVASADTTSGPSITVTAVASGVATFTASGTDTQGNAIASAPFEVDVAAPVVTGTTITVS